MNIHFFFKGKLSREESSSALIASLLEQRADFRSFFFEELDLPLELQDLKNEPVKVETENKSGLSPKKRHRNCGDGINRGEEGNTQVA